MDGDFKKLLNAVELMRSAQRSYWLTHSPFMLKEAKRLSKKVDKLIIEIKNKTTPKLF